MSLINQVLRDLQNRQVESPGVGLQAEVRTVSTDNHRSVKGLWALGLISLAALALVVLLPQGGDMSQRGPVAVPPAVISSDAAAAGHAGFSGLHLAAVRLDGAKESSRLLLEFSQPLELPPKILFTERQMTVLLPELVTSARQLPQPELQNDLVSRLNLVQVDHLWQLQVYFSQDVKVDTLSFAADALYGERIAFDIHPQTGEVKPKVLPAPILPVVSAEKVKIIPQPTAPASLTKQARTPSLQERAEAFYQRGVKAAGEQQLPAALKYWQQTLRLQPEHLAARKQLIYARLSANPDLADSLFAEGLSLHNPLALRKWYARALLPVVGAARAAAVLDGQAVSVLDDPEYRALQAGLWQQTGDYPRSRQGYLELLQQFPANGLYWFGLAVAHDQLAEGEKALAAYRHALAGDLTASVQNYAKKRIEALALHIGAGN